MTALFVLSGCALWPREPDQAVGTTPVAGGPSCSAGARATDAAGVGQAVSETWGELERLRASVAGHTAQLQKIRAKIDADSRRYRGTVAAIDTGLQAGGPPADPDLGKQFNAAKSDLDELWGNIDALNKLGGAVIGDSKTASCLGDSVRATSRVPGIADGGRTNLASLRNEVDRTAVDAGRLLGEASDDIRRQTVFVSAERSNLDQLAARMGNDRIDAASPAEPTIVSTPGGGGPASPDGPPSADIGNRPPLVVVRFDGPDVRYEQAVYDAVSQALEQRPNANIYLVAVAPSGGGAARVSVEPTGVGRRAENVRRSLVDRGVPPSRIATLVSTSPTATADEVRVYVR